MESSKFYALFLILTLCISSFAPALSCGSCNPSKGKHGHKKSTPKLPVPPVTVPKLPVPPVTVPKLPVPPVTVPKLPVPPVTVPKLPVPPVTVPKLPVPPVTVPKLPVPPVTVPKLPVPPVTVPKLPVPPVTVPKLPVPPVTVPNLPVPPVTVPKLPVPPVTVPKLPVPLPPLPVPKLPVPLPPLPVLNPPATGGKPCPPPPGKAAKCPVDTLKLGACIDLLGGLVKIGLGDPTVNKCCPLVQGLAEVEAAACLCTTLKLKALDLKIYVPIALQLLVTCGKTPPPGYTCTL